VLWLSRLLEMTAQGHKFDIIHAHEWSSVQVAQIASRVLNIPVVSTMHLCMSSLWDKDKPMELPDYVEGLLDEYRDRKQAEYDPLTDGQREELERQAVVQRAANDEVDSWISNQEGKLCVENGELILCSSAYCEIAEEYYHINSVFGKSPFMIPNGIDLKDWYPGAGDAARARQAHDKIGRRPIALFVGRIATMKGVSPLLKAVTDEDTGYQVVLVGEVNADIGKEEWHVTQWIRALEAKYPERLAWIGFQRDQELKDLYAAAECVIMPSITEPFGIVALESMAMGAPLISTSVDGLGEVVTEGDERFALVIPPNDSNAINQALRVMADEGECAYWRAQGLGRVKDPKFNWDEIADQTVGVYREITKASKQRDLKEA
jgi:glycosyltransferase involved in cell wall biosynthesis